MLKYVSIITPSKGRSADDDDDDDEATQYTRLINLISCI